MDKSRYKDTGCGQRIPRPPSGSPPATTRSARVARIARLRAKLEHEEILLRNIASAEDVDKADQSRAKSRTSSASPRDKTSDNDRAMERRGIRVEKSMRFESPEPNMFNNAYREEFTTSPNMGDISPQLIAELDSNITHGVEQGGKKQETPEKKGKRYAYFEIDTKEFLLTTTCTPKANLKIVSHPELPLPRPVPRDKMRTGHVESHKIDESRPSEHHGPEQSSLIDQQTREQFQRHRFGFVSKFGLNSVLPSRHPVSRAIDNYKKLNSPNNQGSGARVRKDGEFLDKRRIHDRDMMQSKVAAVTKSYIMSDHRPIIRSNRGKSCTKNSPNSSVSQHEETIMPPKPEGQHTEAFPPRTTQFRRKDEIEPASPPRGKNSPEKSGPDTDDKSELLPPRSESGVGTQELLYDKELSVPEDKGPKLLPQQSEPQTVNNKNKTSNLGLARLDTDKETAVLSPQRPVTLGRSDKSSACNDDQKPEKPALPSKIPVYRGRIGKSSACRPNDNTKPGEQTFSSKIPVYCRRNAKNTACRQENENIKGKTHHLANGDETAEAEFIELFEIFDWLEHTWPPVNMSRCPSMDTPLPEISKVVAIDPTKSSMDDSPKQALPSGRPESRGRDDQHVFPHLRAHSIKGATPGKTLPPIKHKIPSGIDIDDFIHGSPTNRYTILLPSMMARYVKDHPDLPPPKAGSTVRVSDGIIVDPLTKMPLPLPSIPTSYKQPGPKIKHRGVSNKDPAKHSKGDLPSTTKLTLVPLKKIPKPMSYPKPPMVRETRALSLRKAQLAEAEVEKAAVRKPIRDISPPPRQVPASHPHSGSDSPDPPGYGFRESKASILRRLNQQRLAEENGHEQEVKDAKEKLTKVHPAPRHATKPVREPNKEEMGTYQVRETKASRMRRLAKRDDDAAKEELDKIKDAKMPDKRSPTPTFKPAPPKPYKKPAPVAVRQTRASKLRSNQPIEPIRKPHHPVNISQDIADSIDHHHHQTNVSVVASEGNNLSQTGMRGSWDQTAPKSKNTVFEIPRTPVPETASTAVTAKPEPYIDYSQTLPSTSYAGARTPTPSPPTPSPRIAKGGRKKNRVFPPQEAVDVTQAELSPPTPSPRIATGGREKNMVFPPQEAVDETQAELNAVSEPAFSDEYLARRKEQYEEFERASAETQQLIDKAFEKYESSLSNLIRLMGKAREEKELCYKWRIEAEQYEISTGMLKTELEEKKRSN